MTTTKKIMMGVIAAAAALALSTGASFADHHFTGTWKVKDTAGKDFQIVLTEDGTASADRSGEGLKGKWAEAADAVTITWDSGWKTKIAKDGEAYRYLVESIRRFPDQERFAAMIRGAGFERVQYRNLTGGIAALHSGWRI